MLAELVRQNLSLTVLKVRLQDVGTIPATAVRAHRALARRAPSAADRTRLRVVCELQVTGNLEDRGLMPLASRSSDRAPSRRSPNRRYIPDEEAGVGAEQRTLARWVFTPEEVHLPVGAGAADHFREKPSWAGGWLTDVARYAASKVLSEMRLDTLERVTSSLSWLPSGPSTLPAMMTRQLHALLSSVMREGDSLWLELVEPVGYLPLLPWEEMLRPVTAAPILRLSPHALRGPLRNGVSVALCVTVPSDGWAPTAEEMTTMVGKIRESLPVGSMLHVFADVVCRPAVAMALSTPSKGTSADVDVTLYELPRVSDQPPKDEDLWRTWVLESLAGRAVDIVHFVAAGMLFGDDSRLVLAREPVSRDTREGGTPSQGRPLRYLTPFDLSETLTRLGAWASVFSTPTRGSWLPQSRLALRLIADHVGRLRPGVTVFHDLGADGWCQGLGETYRFMIRSVGGSASVNAGVAVYCHPERSNLAAVDAQSGSKELLEQFEKLQELWRVVSASGATLPAWVGATQRLVEQAVSKAAMEHPRALQDASVRGLIAAMKIIQHTFATSEKQETPQTDQPAERSQATSVRGISNG